MRLRRAFRRIERPWCCPGLSGRAALRPSSRASMKLPATGAWPISTRRYSRVILPGTMVMTGPPSIHHQERLRQSARGVIALRGGSGFSVVSG